MTNCHCPAYPFPHRRYGGKCTAWEDCGSTSHHWEDCMWDESCNRHQAAYQPETYWTHPSLTSGERNPGMCGQRGPT